MTLACICVSPAWTRFGAATRQTRAGEPTSEACLFLNIWAPTLDGARRPVMVWLHGGGHGHGSGADPLTDGADPVRRADVVVATLNHRLAVPANAYPAALGVLAVDESGNSGGLGIVLSLRWVRDSTAGLGGSPARGPLSG